MSFFASIYRRRHLLSLYTLGLVSMVAAVIAVSSRDVSGLWLRSFVVFLTAGVALLLPWRISIPAAAAIWIAAGVSKGVFTEAGMFGLNTLLELPGLAGVVIFAIAFRYTLHELERDSVQGAGSEATDPETGVLEERALRPALEVELARSRRFNHSFALVLVDIDEKHQRYAYRDVEQWRAGFKATADLLRKTRTNVDRVYRYGPTGFALLLPESAEKQVTGLVRRLRKLAAGGKPREAEPGGPLPVAFGATFFPGAAGTVDDLLRRAEVAQRVASRNSSRLQLDGAAAPPLEAPETLRQPDAEIEPELVAAVVAQDEPEQVAEPVAAAEAAVPAIELTTPELISAVLLQSGDQSEENEAAVPQAEPVLLEAAATATVASERLAEKAEAERLLSAVSASPRLSDEDMRQLLSRMDKTLGMLRDLKAKAS